MKNQKLTSVDLHEMDQEDLRNTNGGVFWLVPLVVGLSLSQIFIHWDHFKEGLQGEPELVENQPSGRLVFT